MTVRIRRVHVFAEAGCMCACYRGGKVHVCLRARVAFKRTSEEE